MTTPEGRVKAEIKAWLKEQGAYLFMPVQSGYGASTIDILACLNGRFIGIEVKAGKNGPTARQKLTLDAIIKAGGLAFCAWSVDDVRLRLM